MFGTIAAGSLWQDRTYRRLWLSLLASGFAGQISALAVSLTAAILLHVTPAQLGVIGAFGALPFVLLMLPAGVWLDRSRKLRVYVISELVMAATLVSVPIAWAFDHLVIELLYLVSFVGGCVSVVSGTAAQIVLTQIVRRDQLVEAHGKNRVAGSLAEIAGPGIAGILIKLVGAPLAIVANCVLALCSVAILRSLGATEPPVATASARFWPQLKEGVRFVASDRLLLSMGLSVACWQLFQTCATITQVLMATRELGMNELEFGLCLTCAGLCAVAAGSFGHHVARRIGPGPAMIVGMVISGAGWLQLALAPSIASFIITQICFSTGVVLIFSNMLALRQAMTPPAMLARMTSTMRWMTLFPAWPGTLIGGTLAEDFGLRMPLAAGGIGALVLALFLWRYSAISSARQLDR